MEVCVEFWGDFACFSPPYEKVERLSYPFPTPSAARGMLSAIYSKPKEFYWQITRIEVLSPISYISFKRNEIKDTVSDKPVNTDDSRTQRLTTALKDVRYRITAAICPRPEFAGSARTALSAGAAQNPRREVLYAAVPGNPGICRLF